MKKQVSPIVIGVVLAVVLIAVGFFGFRMMQPAPYTPSPGVASSDSPGDTAGQPMSPGEQAYQQSLSSGGGTPGVPIAPSAPRADSGSPTTGEQGQVHVAPD